MDSKWNILNEFKEKAPDYDPRKRSWYKASKKDERPLLSEAYMFNSLKKLGITGSKRLTDGTGVFGVDMTLQDLDIFVEEEKPSENGGIIIYDQKNRILSSTENLKKIYKDSLIRLSELPSAPAGKNILKYNTSWNDGSVTDINIVVISPLSDFTLYLENMKWTIYTFSLLLLLMVIIISIFTLQKITSILTELAIDSERVRNFDFTGVLPKESVFREFHQLSSGFHHMKTTIKERTEELDTARLKLEKIIDLSIAMAAERDVNHLVELILEGAKNLSHAGGGSVYLKESDDSLNFKIVLNDSLGFSQGGTGSNPITLPPVALYDKESNPNHKNVVTHAFHTGETVNIEDAYNNNLFDFSGTRIFDKNNNYESHSFLTIPLKPRGGEVMGALQLINVKDVTNENIISFTKDIQRFVEALSAAAATSLYNWELLETQQKLFDSMIKFTAGAIDAKSHYTGGHCVRVPEIALKLAEAAHNVTDGPLSDFKLNTSEEKREFKIAT